MGLKKPVKTGPDLPSLDELIGVDAYPVETDGYIVLGTVPGRACTMESNTPISIKAELGKFGDATAADVASGKTMTSAEGLKVAGSLPEVASGSTETLTYAGPSFASGNVRMTGTVGTDKIMRAGSKVMTSIGGNYFGNATAADVVSGKTFTSSAGLKVAGTKEDIQQYSQVTITAKTTGGVKANAIGTTQYTSNMTNKITVPIGTTVYVNYSSTVVLTFDYS